MKSFKENIKSIFNIFVINFIIFSSGKLYLYINDSKLWYDNTIIFNLSFD